MRNCVKCEEYIIKELEQKLISLSIRNHMATGNEFLEMGRRVHEGKEYKVFIKVEAIENEKRN